MNERSESSCVHPFSGRAEWLIGVNVMSSIYHCGVIVVVPITHTMSQHGTDRWWRLPYAPSLNTDKFAHKTNRLLFIIHPIVLFLYLPVSLFSVTDGINIFFVV